MMALILIWELFWKMQNRESAKGIIDIITKMLHYSRRKVDSAWLNKSASNANKI